MSAVRFYCLVIPGAPGRRPPGFEYLAALHEAGVPVRACPIGPAYVQVDPWMRVAHLFFSDLPATRFVNVVCAPLSFPLGAPQKIGDLAPRVGPRGAIEQADEVVYLPQTAFSGLYTAGCANIAIVTPTPKFDAAELAVVGKYDQVFCPDVEATEQLRSTGIVIDYLAPPALVDVVRTWLT